MPKKIKLFSGKSILISLKGLVSSILTGLTAIPIWGLGYFFMRKGWIVPSLIMSFFVFVWYLVFWGKISNVLWKWN